MLWRESDLDLEFFGTIDQLIGYNVADLRAKENLSQSDIATIFERVTGRERSRNWLSQRETGRQPFTVAEVLILATYFEVSVLRLFKLPYGKDGGVVYVDGLTKPAARLIYDFVTDAGHARSDFADIANEREKHAEEEVGKLVENTPSVPTLLAHGVKLKAWAAHLRATRDEWLPQVGAMNRKWEQTIRGAHEPHPGAGKRYTAWLRRRRENQAKAEEALRLLRGDDDGDDQED